MQIENGSEPSLLLVYDPNSVRFRITMSVEDDDDLLIEELRVAREDLEYILELVKLEIRRK